jgi:hypothetical protein
MGLLIFGRLGRITFGRDRDGLRVGGPLAGGLAALLTIAIIVWAHENGRTIQEFGPWAAGLVCGAIITLGVSAFRKAGRE